MNEAAHPRPALREKSLVGDLVGHLVLIIAVYALINLATVRFVVDGPSMEPTFETGQFLIISRLHYLLGEPERGDIAVFHYPNDPDSDYIKRVIGLPGDRVEVRPDGVFVNGEHIDEPYTLLPCDSIRCGDDEWLLADDEYFFMGDNRNRSSDSRDFGPVKRRFIVGEVIFRYWPLALSGTVN